MANPPDHTVELYSVIGGCFAVISGLVGVLYSRLNSDRKDQQTQLDEGTEVFAQIRERISALETTCKNCNDLDRKETVEFQRITVELGKLHDDVVRLMERHHREDRMTLPEIHV